MKDRCTCIFKFKISGVTPLNVIAVFQVNICLTLVSSLSSAPPVINIK
jgi:hypothetical protein